MSFNRAGETARTIQSASQLQLWGLAIDAYERRNGQGAFPANLEALRPFTDNFDQLIKNPVTGDNPGYELAQPTVERHVTMYQLRNGKRDTALDVLYVDGSVGPLK
jgi:hypothetical protein